MKIFPHRVNFLMFLFLLIVSSTAFGAAPSATTLGLNPIDKMKPNGEYIVEVLKDGKWLEAGQLSFDKYYRDRQLDLAKFITVNEPVKIRLMEKGGGAAHIDQISLGGASPVGAQFIGASDAVGSPQPHGTILKKVSKKDFDVIDAFEKTLEFTFPAVNAGAIQLPLRLTARVEPTVISETPFQYPYQNLFRPMTEQSTFLTYKLNSAEGTLDVDGKIDQTSGEKPFLTEYAESGSGHPSGFTYVWVKNDSENLYVAMDFTADDTYDGDKDYAKVYVKTGNGLKEFKVSVPEAKWGRADFAYTDKVAYEHKIYKFKIPLSEIGKIDTVQLAFASYGTASTSTDRYTPKLVYDSANNRYLLVYRNDAQFISGQLLNPDGTAFGAAFPICNNSNSHPWDGFSVAYDNVNQRFLVVWNDSRNGNNDIYGQMVNADGTLYNTTSVTNFVISNNASDQNFPSVAYDSANQRFLVAWQDSRNGNYDIYGQLVNADGAPYNTLTNVNFVISNSAGDQEYPSVAYDSANHRFLVAWQDYRSGNYDIYGQMVNAGGTLYNTTSDTNFVISNGASNQNYPSVAYDSANQRFLVAWQDYRDGTDIYGQLVNYDGNLYGTTSGVNFIISNEGDYQWYPSVAYDSAHQRFLVVWHDYRNGNYDIYGQLIDADGTLHDTASDINFVIYSAANDQLIPSVAYNSTCANFLTAYQTWETSAPDIGLSLVGPSCPCVQPPSGMVAWWGGDNNALDMVNGNNGTPQGGATYAAGKVGQAFSLNGVNSYVSIPDNASLRATGAISIDFWANFNDINSTHTLMEKENDYYLVWTSDKVLRIYFTDALDGLYHISASAPLPSLQSGVWHHFAFTAVDPIGNSAADIRIYVDGVEQSVTDGSIPSHAAAGWYAGTAGGLRIGARTVTGYEDFFNGLIDEVEIFNRVLSASEIAAIYNAGSAGKCRSCATPPSGMVSWWRAEDNAVDIVGGNNGTLQNGATYSTGKVGQAFSFDGVNDYIALPAGFADFTSGFTVALWANPTASGSWARFIDLGNGQANDNILFDRRTTSNDLAFEVYDGAGNSTGMAYTVDAITNNEWHHYAATLDASGKVKMYKDGLPLVMAADTTGVPNNVTRVNNYIGKSNWSYDAFYAGSMDEVQIFNRALSANEIAAIYNASSSGECVPQRTLTVTKSGTGTGNVTAGANCTLAWVGNIGTCTVDAGTAITLSGTAGTGSTFGGWSDGTGSALSCSGTGDCSFNITADSGLTATFTLNTYTVTANAGGSGAGNVSSDTGGINYNYSANNSGTTTSIDYGTKVVLTAAANAGSTASWNDCSTAGGAAAGNGTQTATCTFNSLDGNKTVTATFSLRTSVDIAAATGNGNINLTTSSPGCGFYDVETYTESQVPAADPQHDYPYGLVAFKLSCSDASVTLTFPGDVTGTTYCKYGPTTPGNPATTAWYPFNANVAGNQVTLHLVDGQLGDDTGVDGIIVDQGGPGAPAAVVPTVDEWGMIIFMILAGFGGVLYLRRQRA